MYPLEGLEHSPTGQEQTSVRVATSKRSQPDAYGRGCASHRPKKAVKSQTRFPSGRTVTRTLFVEQYEFNVGAFSYVAYSPEERNLTPYPDQISAHVTFAGVSSDTRGGADIVAEAVLLLMKEYPAVSYDVKKCPETGRLHENAWARVLHRHGVSVAEDQNQSGRYWAYVSPEGTNNIADERKGR